MFDIYQTVTDKILTALESGNIPWIKPWKDSHGYGDAGLPYNGSNGRNYNGINLLLLGMGGYSSNAWVSFKQAAAMGGSVKKGEKGSMVVFWSRKVKKDKDGNEKATFLLRYYTVFNIEQCEGIAPEKVKRPKVGTIANTTAHGVAIQHDANLSYGGNRAFYSPATDSIQMPPQEAFKSIQEHDATLFHELTHWTSHKARCDRDLSAGRFGNAEYAFEELVAELGSAFLCARVGIEQTTQASAYIQGWIKVLKDDKTAIYKASKLAQQAADYLLPYNDDDSNSDAESTDED